MFKTLATHGRLAIPVILRLSRLSLSQVKHSLVVLVQQHLAVWYTDSATDTTYYEANWTGAYALVRSGKYIRVVEDRFGKVASGILKNFLLLGHIRVIDLESAYNLTRDGVTSADRLNGLNSIGNGNIDQDITVELLHETLLTLLQHRILSIVHDSHFRSDADNRAEAEAVVRSRPKFSGILKGKQNADLEDAVQDVLEDWKTRTDEIKEILLDAGFSRLRKRRLDPEDENVPQKKQRLINGFTFLNAQSKPSRNGLIAVSWKL